MSTTENPYVGPRTFTREESHLFFGREREARQLLSRVISERLVLFYAQSGAGKSSLINTRLIPQLQKAGYKVFPRSRVSGELPEGLGQVDNIFVFNLMLNLDQRNQDPTRFARDVSLSQFLAELITSDPFLEHSPNGEALTDEDHGDDDELPHVLIIDQFEELITTHSARWQEREGFFRQLDQAMTNDPLLWVVLTLREDFVAALEPYAYLLTDKIRARYHLQRMEYQAALEAAKKPAEQAGRPFSLNVAETLVNNLRRLRIAGQVEANLGQFIEPVQLQVVCYQLWENLREKPTSEITLQDLQELGNIDVALAQFYERAIARVLEEIDDVSETYLRDWFERKLITEAGTRGTIYRGIEKTGGLPTSAVDLLVNQFLLRTENRRGGIWYELIHDRFVEPILQANQAWHLQQGSREQLDPIIIAELPEAEKTIYVEQTAIFELTLVNGGAIEAQFTVSVEGLDESWISISQPNVVLDEGERVVTTIEITPPRLPASRSGRHQFKLVITSPDFPNRRSERDATLVINPYYEFVVDELSPKRQTLSWNKRSGQAFLPIKNTGNSTTLFRLEGIDGERACRFEFGIPGEKITVVTQVQLRLNPEESVAVPIRISPLSRRFIAFRKRFYPFTITASLIEGFPVSRHMAGELSQRPLIGPWTLLLAVILFMVGIVFFLMPGPNPRLFKPDQNYIIEVSDNPITLGYNVSRFNELPPTSILNTINANLLDVTVERKISGANDSTYEVVEADLDAPFGMVSDAPTVNVVYRLTVENFLSKFLFSGLQRQTTQRISVEKQPPVITLSANKSEITLGETAILTWTQQYATKLEIKTIEGIPLATIDAPEPDGTFTVQPDSATIYKLEAHNIYTENDDPVEVPVAIRVVVPTPTPTPTATPSIAFFTANPPTIVEGEVATLTWRVNGVQVVTIDGIDETIPLPSEHSIQIRPTVSTDYVLSVPGVPELVPITVRVDVLQATPTPTPQLDAPTINFFDIVSEQITSGGAVEVELGWEVEGEVTNVQISSPHYNSISNLSNVGSITLSVDQTTVFILTALNEDQASSATLQIRVGDNIVSTVEPTATATPTP